jgi:mannose-6-phosphate isomerase-like protein (cupin superfamily)
MSILTSMGRARYKDKAPMEVEGIDGPISVKLKQLNILSFLFRFFTRGYPEIIHCSGERSRLVHGGNAVGLYYTPGLRTAWYQLTKGMVINEDPKDQVNVFDTIIFCVSGEGIAILDGKPYTIKKNTMVMIPKGMRHTFKNEKDEPWEFIIIMFGEQA